MNGALMCQSVHFCRLHVFLNTFPRPAKRERSEYFEGLWRREGWAGDEQAARWLPGLSPLQPREVRPRPLR